MKRMTDKIHRDRAERLAHHKIGLKGDLNRVVESRQVIPKGSPL